jgi:hypothetical protein
VGFGLVLSLEIGQRFIIPGDAKGVRNEVDLFFFFKGCFALFKGHNWITKPLHFQRLLYWVIKDILLLNVIKYKTIK